MRGNPNAFPPGEYGDVSGYGDVELADDDLAKMRAGFSAANPAQVVALVRRIDDLVERTEQRGWLSTWWSTLWRRRP